MKFTSQNGWFSLTLPEDWVGYDDTEQGTYAFFNARSWTGNFRVTPLRREQHKKLRNAAEFIKGEMRDNAGTVKMKLGSFECAHYRKDVEEDQDKLVVYYWATGRKTELFVCTFTIDKENEETQRNDRELQIVQDIIKSIKLN